MKRESGDQVSLPHAGHWLGPISKHTSQSTHSARRCRGTWIRGVVSWARDRMTPAGLRKASAIAVSADSRARARSPAARSDTPSARLANGVPSGVTGEARNAGRDEAASWTGLAALSGSARAGALDGAGEQPGALVAFLRRLVAERQADELLAPAVGIEGRAGRVLHARLDRQLGQAPGVGAGRQAHPEEEPALGPAD